MSVSTHGWRPKRVSALTRNTVELLSSMRFAVSLLTLICIAAIIGTVLKQQEPFSNYINQFGPFWAEVFSLAGLYTVYSAWWFLGILLLLVISTSLCVARNTPKIVRDFNNYREGLREQSLQAFAHQTSFAAPSHESLDQTQSRMAQSLRREGWKLKPQARATGTMLAAKKGRLNRIGYIAAHSAIVLVCVGGLLDGNVMTSLQMWLGNKVPYTGGGLISDVPAQHRLPASNFAYRANLLVAEGQTAGTAVMAQPKGVLLQELPFSIELKKFIIEHYSTGMPKLFASEIVIHNKTTGEAHAARVEVNHPVSYAGLSIYQSSFDDGGSHVTLQSVPLSDAAKPFELQGSIGGQSPLTNGQAQMNLEYSALRVFNVETFGKKDLRNVGPSITYKLRDAAGQAREYNNYMLPVSFDKNEAPVFLLGVRDTPADAFRYWRVPADAQGSLTAFTKLHQALNNLPQREAAIARYVHGAAATSPAAMQQALTLSAQKIMSMFAGDGLKLVSNQNPSKGFGLQAVSDFLETQVPLEQREKTSDVLVRLLNGVLYQLADPEVRGKPEWMSAALLALSDAPAYPAPMIFQLKDFKQVQASVFQVTKSPGQAVVYTGAVLLIIGVFFMLYVRERRLWVWLSSQGQVQMAYSVNRKTRDTGPEFERLRAALLGS